MAFFQRDWAINEVARVGNNLNQIARQLNSQWKNVDLTRGLIYVTNTKSGKDRVIPLNQDARSALESLKRVGPRVFNVDWI